MEKIFICQQCHAELGEDEVDGILGHAVPDYDEDGCNQCGPCEMNRDWALARIKSLKECAAKMQKRILELAENEAVTSANYNGAVARIAELEAQLAAAQGRERWIPASEAPPKNGPYLILFKGKVVYATFLTNGWYQWYYANRVVPDAWRELPAPPEEAADDHK
jgi:hypothetical protein